MRQIPLDRASDAALVQGVVAGSDAAVAMIFRRHAPRLRAVLVRSLGPGHEVDDLLQEIFIGFCRGAHRMRDPAALQGYLVGMALRKARMELRRLKVRRIVGLAPADDFPAAADVPEARRALHALYRILDGLPTRERVVFVARHIEGLTLDEVADAMSLSKATVYRVDKRARQRVVRAGRREPVLADYLPRDAGDDEEGGAP